MPKAEPHFDAPLLLDAVHQQDVGLRISTNDGVAFRRIVYAHGRANPARKVHIYADPRVPQGTAFFLLKARVEAATEATEPTDD